MMHGKAVNDIRFVFWSNVGKTPFLTWVVETPSLLDFVCDRAVRAATRKAVKKKLLPQCLHSMGFASKVDLGTYVCIAWHRAWGKMDMRHRCFTAGAGHPCYSFMTGDTPLSISTILNWALVSLPFIVEALLNLFKIILFWHVAQTPCLTQVTETSSIL